VRFAALISVLSMLRNYKPERTSREEEFVPGIDPGVRDWLVVRQAGRDAQLKGNKTCIVTCDVSYKLNQFWRNQLQAYCDRVTIAEGRTPSGERTSQNQSVSIDSTPPTSTTLIEFQAMLAARTSFEDIVTTAMKKRNNAFIELAIKHGVDINYRVGHSRRTMLHTACRDGEIKKVRFLIEHGADLDLRDSQGYTALHLAIQPPSIFHPLGIITALIEAGCKVNIQNKHGHTPLHTACIVGTKEIIEVLLQHHCLPYILDKKNKLAIDYTRSVSLFPPTLFRVYEHCTHNFFPSAPILFVSLTCVQQLNRQFCEHLATYAVKSHQEKMWAHLIARNVSTSIMRYVAYSYVVVTVQWQYCNVAALCAIWCRLSTPSCDVCLRTLPDCLALKSAKYR
jgi:hypothetical protein